MTHDANTRAYIRQVTIATAIVAAVIMLFLFVWKAIDILLLIFAGILLSIILERMRDYLTEHTRLPAGPALAVVVILLLLIQGLGIMLLVPIIEEQVLILADQLPKSWQNIKDFVSQFGWGQELLDEITIPTDILKTNQTDMRMVTRIVGIFSSTLGALTSIIFILIVAIYLAAEPKVYINGFLRLLPISKRARAMQVMGRLGATIRWWLFGQTLSMLILGILTTLSLWLLDIPLALTLGLLTAIMTFIPNLGPIIAGTPTLLIAMVEGPMKAVYVAILYVVIQSVEGYFITPMVHRKIISIPPVFILSVQILLLTLIGFLGVVLAMPLVACLMVLVQMVYVEDILGDSMEKPIDVGTDKSKTENDG